MSKFINITIEINVNAPIDTVWDTWTNPKHVVKWNHASDDWHSPSARNDLKLGGRFIYRMEAKDGSFGFDFSGTYLEIKEKSLILTRLDDNRLVRSEFIQQNGFVRIVENFEAEDENTLELQRQGWFAILNNYKNYTESLINKKLKFVD